MCLYGFGVEVGGYRDQERRSEILDATIEAMERFWAALTPSLDRIFERQLS
jgi:hypothetical protein